MILSLALISPNECRITRRFIVVRAKAFLEHFIVEAQGLVGGGRATSAFGGRCEHVATTVTLRHDAHPLNWTNLDASIMSVSRPLLSLLPRITWEHRP